MAALRVDLRASNNADWVRGFALERPAAGDLPWQNVPEWTQAGDYQASAPASIVVYEDDLFLAKGPADPTTGQFIKSEWLLIGRAEAYTAEPLDLTGASLSMRLAVVKDDGAVDLDTPALRLSTNDGSLELTSPSNGGVRINLRAKDVRGVAAGKYAYDLLATRGADTMRLLYGEVIIEEGITR